MALARLPPIATEDRLDRQYRSDERRESGKTRVLRVDDSGRKRSLIEIGELNRRLDDG